MFRYIIRKNRFAGRPTHQLTTRRAAEKPAVVLIESTDDDVERCSAAPIADHDQHRDTHQSPCKKM